MNIVLFFALWIQCVGQMYIVCVPLENQSHGVMMCVQWINVWTNPMGLVQRTNPMGICCMYRRPILWDSACSYMYLCTVLSEGSMPSIKDQLYVNSTCTKSSCQTEYLYRGYMQKYRESLQWPVQTCTPAVK